MKRYFGNNGTRRVVVVTAQSYSMLDGSPTQEEGWYELSGLFDWGTLGQRSLRLAYAILRDLGASEATALRYGQKLLLNLISKQPHERRLAITESQVLDNMGCKAVDALQEVGNT